MEINEPGRVTGAAARTGAARAGSAAIRPNGDTVYVGNYGSGTVTPITVATNTAGTPIKTGVEPGWLAAAPGGKTVYVANLGSSTLSPIHPATSTAGKAISTGRAP